MLALACAAAIEWTGSAQWTAAQAHQWHAKQGWLVGSNFLPSTAINQLEMWQAESYDAKTIDRELGWAAGIGMNTMRVYLHDLAYEADPKGFKSRIADFLKIASKHEIRPMFVFFDDCWNPDPRIGKQPDPKPGVHNSGWVRSPGHSQRNWPKDLARLETYVKDVLKTFKNDKRILAWDLYNEPNNSGYEEASMPLLKKVFEWGWAVRPSQPLTVGVWRESPEFNKFQIENSDVLSFHHYGPLPELQKMIADLKKAGRPVLCTEWMARSRGSTIKTHLQTFKDEGVSCIMWGLVSGRSNTIFPWGGPEGAPEPKPWFHDLFRKDGSPYDPTETALIKRLMGR